MFLLKRPTAEFVRQFIAAQSEAAFSYADVGATATKHYPAGYRVDHNQIQLGVGNETYRRAIEALKQWRQFDLGWVTALPKKTIVSEGVVVAVLARAAGLWSLNAARIVYVIDDEQEAHARFGFAYGTLTDHVEQGEERFMVQRQDDGSVWYDLYAFSRPQHALARLGFPFVRMLQKRFAKESLAAMAAATR